MHPLYEQQTQPNALTREGAPEQMLMPYEHGCLILRGGNKQYVVRHKKYANRYWETNDLNTAKQICDELNCE